MGDDEGIFELAEAWMDGGSGFAPAWDGDVEGTGTAMQIPDAAAEPETEPAAPADS